MQITEKMSDVLASNAEVLMLEKRIGARLPLAYKSFLMRVNGGSPLPTKLVFQTDSGQSNSLVDWFYSLCDSSMYNLTDRIGTYRARIPSNMIPIACDPFGNQFLMKLGDERGAIYFWDHELENEEDDSQRSNVYLIADSFCEFAKMFP